MTDGSGPLYPNRGRDGQPPVSRRRFIEGSVAVGAATTAGCSGGSDQSATTESTGSTVLVFNTGDRTVSLIDTATDEVVKTTHVGLTSSFPSNQYTPALVDNDGDRFWVNVDRSVRALDAGNLAEEATVETGSGANWQERTPDGKYLIASAREPAHTQYKIDADPESNGFGEVIGKLDRSSEGGRGNHNGPGPCDVTIHPDGTYAYVPDLFGETLTVIDTESFDVETQVDVDPLVDGPAKPWMGTVGPAGDRLLVEHKTGIETIWDVSDPAAPTELARLTSEDNLGSSPLTSEIGPDGETGYVFTPGSNDISVIDIEGQAVDDRIDLGGSAFTGTWDPTHETLYVPVQTEDVVKVIDHATGEISATLDVGPKPYGATAAMVRPDPEQSNSTAAALDRIGATDDSGTSYCIGKCACGHEL